MPYKPNDKGKKYDERMKLHRIASKSTGRNCSDYNHDGDKSMPECMLTEGCNWKEQEYTPIPRWCTNIEDQEECCCGIIIKEEELEEKK